MADRYWVGGSGNWDDTNKWSATSGGAGGASVPTAEDNAYFDGNSDAGSAFTVTLNATALCKDFIVGDGTRVSLLDQPMTLSHGAFGFAIYGSLYWPSTNFSKPQNSIAGNVFFRATTAGQTIVTNGHVITNGLSNALYFGDNGAGGEWTLGSALTASSMQGNSSIYVNGGTLRTNGYTISCNGFFSSTSTTRAIYLGSSTFNTGFSGGPTGQNNELDLSTTNLTWDAGTSTINIGTGSGGVNGGSRMIVRNGALTFNVINMVGTGGFYRNLYLNGSTVAELNVSYTSSAFPAEIYGVNSFGTFTCNSHVPGSVVFYDNQTIGTLNILVGRTSSSAASRLLLRSGTFAQPCTLTVGAANIGVGLNLRDITLTGSAAPLDLTAKYAGNCGGNTGFTFPTPKTVYWNLAGTQNWTANGWAATSGGAPAAANFPLPQDTAVFNNAGAADTVTLPGSATTYVTNLDFSGRTTAVLLAFGNSANLSVLGDLKLSSALSFSLLSQPSLSFVGYRTQMITASGVPLSMPINVSPIDPSFGIQLQDNLTCTSMFYLTRGRVDVNNKILTVFAIRSDNSETRHIAFGDAGEIRCTRATGNAGDGVIEMANLTNLTLSGSRTLKLMSSWSVTTDRLSMSLGGWGSVTEDNVFDLYVTSGSYLLWLYRGANVRNLNFTGFSGSVSGEYGPNMNVYGSVVFSGSMTGLSSTLVMVGTSQSARTITTNGRELSAGVYVGTTSTITLSDNVTLPSTATFTLEKGTLNLNGKTLTTGIFNTSYSTVRQVVMAMGAINCTGSGTAFNAATATQLSFTGQGVIRMSSDSSKTFSGGNGSYPTLELAGAGALAITGSNTFANIRNAATAATSITFPNTQTNVAKFSAGGKSSTSQLTLIRTGASGTFTLNYTGSGKVQTDNVVLAGCQALPANTWFAYRSTDGGGNSGWSFTLDADTDRYWVGGTRVWSDSNSWAAVPGGSPIGGGLAAALPNAKGSAYFGGESDAGSAFTVSIDVNNAVCNDFVVGDGFAVSELDQIMTLAGSSAISIAGSLYLPSTKFVANYAGPITMSATSPGKTVTMNGHTITNAQMYFSGAGGEWTLGSAIPSGARTIAVLSLIRGTLRTAGYNISVAQFYMIDQLGAVLYAESSQIYCSITFLLNSGSTVHAGTSTFTIGYGQFATNYNKASTSPAVFHNVVLTSTSVLSGPTTFNDLAFSAVGAGVTRTSISDTQTVLGTLRVSSGNTDVRNRRMLTSANGATISAASVDIGAGVDFAGINASGASSPWNLANLYAGDCGGNSGIVFPAPKTVYWNLGGGQGWNANAWASTPSGTPAANNFPLPQDTAVVTEAGAAGTIVNNSGWNIGNLLFDDGVNPRVSAVTFDISSGMYLTGDLKLSSGVSLSGTQAVFITGRRSQKFASAGKLFLGALAIDSVSGTVTLQDDCSFASLFQFNSGTLDLNGKTLSATVFNSSYSTVRKIIFNGGKVQLTGGGARVMECSTMTNFSYTGEPEFESTYTGNLYRQFSAGASSGALESPAFNLTITAGSGVVDFISGGYRSAFRNVKFLDGFTGGLGQSVSAAGYGTMPIVYGDLTLPKNQTFYSNGADDRAWILASGSRAQTVRGGGAVLHDLNVSSSGSASVSLGENVTFRNVTLTSGELKLNDKVLTAGSFTSSNTNQRSLVFGSGRLLLNGTGTVWNMTTSTNATITPGTGKIELTDGSDAARTFIGGGIQTYPELEIGGLTGSSTTTITGANRFKRLSSSKEVAHTIVFPNALTQVDGWGVNGREGQLVTLARTGSSGKFQLRYTGSGYLLGRHLSISNSDASPTGRWYALYSTDGGNNTGWTFGPPKFGQFLSFFEI